MQACQIHILYDGDCPLCSREIQLLRWLDRGRRQIGFVDIAAPDFDAGVYGLDAGAAMDRIHGVLPGGTIIEGVEVFRRAYAAVGLGWLLAPTAWPGLRRMADSAYASFARNRLRWTGRSGGCTGGRCSAAGPAPAPPGRQHPNAEVPR
jgi:predicted DCC family thiol-disulfide oxidoreductase YuxK